MRDKNKFKTDLEKALGDAQMEAQKVTFDMGSIGEIDSVGSIAEKVAQKTSKKFAEVLAPKLQKAIDDYLDSLEFDVSGLANSGGTVVGILKIK